MVERIGEEEAKFVNDLYSYSNQEQCKHYWPMPVLLDAVL